MIIFKILNTFLIAAVLMRKPEGNSTLHLCLVKRRINKLNLLGEDPFLNDMIYIFKNASEFIYAFCLYRPSLPPLPHIIETDNMVYCCIKTPKKVGSQAQQNGGIRLLNVCPQSDNSGQHIFYCLQIKDTPGYIWRTDSKNWICFVRSHLVSKIWHSFISEQFKPRYERYEMVHTFLTK